MKVKTNWLKNLVIFAIIVVAILVIALMVSVAVMRGGNGDVAPHVHAYGEPRWVWSGYESAEAVFTCADDRTHSEKITAVVTESEAVAASCTVSGRTIYRATVVFEGEEYTDEKSEIIVATGHFYGEIVWEWASDYSSATAIFTCARDGHIERIDATITVSMTKIPTYTEKGIKTITASVTVGEKTYIDEKSVEMDVIRDGTSDDDFMKY